MNISVEGEVILSGFHVLLKVGDEVWKVNSLHWVELNWLSSLGHWADGQDENFSDVITGIVVVLGGPVGTGLLDIGVNLLPVGEEVSSNLLDELLWVLEDGSPGLDLLNVTLDVFAVAEVSWELLNDLSNFLNTLDDILNITLGEIRDCVGDFGLE